MAFGLRWTCLTRHKDTNCFGNDNEENTRLTAGEFNRKGTKSAETEPEELTADDADERR